MSPSALFEAPNAGDLSRRSTRNIGINLVAQGFRFALQMVSTIALARLLGYDRINSVYSKKRFMDTERSRYTP